MGYLQPSCSLTSILIPTIVAQLYLLRYTLTTWTPLIHCQSNSSLHSPRDNFRTSDTCHPMSKPGTSSIIADPSKRWGVALTGRCGETSCTEDDFKSVLNELKSCKSQLRSMTEAHWKGVKTGFRDAYRRHFEVQPPSALEGNETNLDNQSYLTGDRFLGELSKRLDFRAGDRISEYRIREVDSVVQDLFKRPSGFSAAKPEVEDDGFFPKHDPLPESVRGAKFIQPIDKSREGAHSIIQGDVFWRTRLITMASERFTLDWLDYSAVLRRKHGPIFQSYCQSQSIWFR